MRRGSSRLLLAAALAVSLAPAVAGAQSPVTTGETPKPPAADAEARFAAGQKLYTEKAYEQALVELRASHVAAPSPNSRLYIARSLRDLGRAAEAEAEYARVILEAADRLDARYDATAKAAADERAALPGHARLPPPAGPAAADAEKRFAAGQKLYADKAFDQALVELRASHAAVPSPNSRLYVARALREQGRPWEAFDEYGQVILDAADRLDPRYDPTRKAAADERAALRNRIATLVLDVPAGVEGLKVRVGADEIPASRWNGEITVPAALLTVRAEAPGRAPFERSLTLAAGGRDRVVVELAPASPVPASTSVLRPVSFAVAGLGVVGLVLWGALGVQASSRYDGLVQQCGGRCGPAFQGSVNAGRAETAGSQAGLAIGILGLCGGAAIFTVDLLRRPAQHTGALTLRVSMDPRGPGAALGGGF